MLGEWVGWRRWTAIMVGFVGVLVVVAARAWAACSGRRCSRSAARSATPFYNITTRMLSRTDSSETTLFYANLFGCRGHGAGAAVRLDAAAVLDRLSC